MTKQLVTIEFRYREVPKSDLMSGHTSKTITIGVYDTIEEAVDEGNKALNKLAKKYKFYDCFKVRGFMGKPDRLVCSYRNGMDGVFAHIIELKFDDVEETMREVAESNAKYKKWAKD